MCHELLTQCALEHAESALHDTCRTSSDLERVGLVVHGAVVQCLCSVLTDCPRVMWERMEMLARWEMMELMVLMGKMYVACIHIVSC